MELLGFPKNGKPMLVAVSGGVDSMVLVSLLHENGYLIAVAHCNYGLRGADSNEDETLVKTWCEDRKIPFHLKKVDTKKLVTESASSIQMVARDERYRFFEELMAEHGYLATALAHHANDRVESLVINVLRGTGFRGFQGMPSKRDNYIRPLLGFRKDEIREYAIQKSVPFREDASNAETHYQRNWIRLRVLPMLQAFNEDAFYKLLLLTERAEMEQGNYQNWKGAQYEAIRTENGVSIRKLRLSRTPFTILKEILEPKGFSSDQVFEVLDILDSVSGTEVSSETHRVLKDRDELLISELDSEEIAPNLQFELLERGQVRSLSTDPNIAFMDADRLEVSNLSFDSGFPDFQLRKWQQGDRFQPLGMNGWKLLSDFFIDQKFSISEKKKTWVLTFRNEIVWVVGKRLDNRFRVTPNTKKVLKLTVTV
jgi:tRNA(Ile)-lysidine synthase